MTDEAQNPTDVLHIDYVGPAGSIVGCDLVGTVVALGSSNSKHQIGERVFSAVHGGKYPNIGSAAEYCIVPDSLAIRVPESMPSTEAVTFGVGFLTACIVRTQHITLTDSHKLGRSLTRCRSCTILCRSQCHPPRSRGLHG